MSLPNTRGFITEFTVLEFCCKGEGSEGDLVREGKLWGRCTMSQKYAIRLIECS